MKKAFPLILALMLCLSLCACGGNGTSEEKNPEPMPSTEPASESIDGMRPEFKEAMDAYEAFYEEYCEFMISYKENPTDTDLLLKYSELLTNVEEIEKAFEEWDEAEMNDVELKYYLDVTNRVMKMLVDVSG